LRVEDHPNPIVELKRLLDLHRVYSLIDDSEDKLTKGDLKTALVALKKAISMNPNIDDAYIDLGIVNLKLGKKKEAISAFKKALRLNPKMKILIKQLPATGLMEPNKEIFAELGIT
jgi:tetratricopeptide (TPR) repeat protein